jgi:hypothetical protein
MQLALSLRLLGPEEPLAAALETFADLYRDELGKAVTWRLGVEGVTDPIVLVQAIAEALRTAKLPIDNFFFGWFGGQTPAGYPGFEAVTQALAGARPRKSRDHAYWNEGPCSMLIEEVEAIWARIDTKDDWQPFHDKIAAIRRMGEALA